MLDAFEAILQPENHTHLEALTLLADIARRKGEVTQ